MKISQADTEQEILHLSVQKNPTVFMDMAETIFLSVVKVTTSFTVVGTTIYISSILETEMILLKIMLQILQIVEPIR